MAFNHTRAAATLTGPRLARARTATLRRTLITVPDRGRLRPDIWQAWRDAQQP